MSMNSHIYTYTVLYADHFIHTIIHQIIDASIHTMSQFILTLIQAVIHTMSNIYVTSQMRYFYCYFNLKVHISSYRSNICDLCKHNERQKTTNQKYLVFFPRFPWTISPMLQGSDFADFEQTVLPSPYQTRLFWWLPVAGHYLPRPCTNRMPPCLMI